MDQTVWRPMKNASNPFPHLLAVVVLVCALPMQAALARDKSGGAIPKGPQSESPKQDHGAPSNSAIDAKGRKGHESNGPSSKGQGTGTEINNSHATTPSDHPPPQSEKGAERNGERGKSTLEGNKGSKTSKGDIETKAKAAIDGKKGEDTSTAPIDTSIPEPSKRPLSPLKAPDKSAPIKAISKPTNVPPPARNAIGAVLTPEPTVQPRQGPVLGPGSATGTTGTNTGDINGGRSATTGITNPNGQQAKRQLATTSPVANLAVVNGTGLGRLAQGAPIVRGGAKSTAQINGATIRAKH